VSFGIDRDRIYVADDFDAPLSKDFLTDRKKLKT